MLIQKFAAVAVSTNAVAAVPTLLCLVDRGLIAVALYLLAKHCICWFRILLSCRGLPELKPEADVAFNMNVAGTRKLQSR